MSAWWCVSQHQSQQANRRVSSATVMHGKPGLQSGVTELGLTALPCIEQAKHHQTTSVLQVLSRRTRTQGVRFPPEKEKDFFILALTKEGSKYISKNEN